MNQASLYSKNNGLQRNDAAFVIDNYLRLIKWKSNENENILDIGCGDGNVTLDLLLPRLPKNFGKLVGVDVSEEMVQFARKTCTNPKVDFVELDLSACYIPPEFHGEFDHIFSFYCLHWIINQRQCFKNIFDLLKPGGDILLTFLANNPIYDVYESMAKSNKWSKYMQNLEKYISPYHHSKDPEADLEAILQKQGFITHLCRIEGRCYVFPSFCVLEKSAAAVNPFIKKLPENEVTSYVADYCKEVRKLKTVTIESCKNNNNEEEIHVPYNLFVVFASKPL